MLAQNRWLRNRQCRREKGERHRHLRHRLRSRYRTRRGQAPHRRHVFGLGRDGRLDVRPYVDLHREKQTRNATSASPMASSTSTWCSRRPRADRRNKFGSATWPNRASNPLGKPGFAPDKPMEWDYKITPDPQRRSHLPVRLPPPNQMKTEPRHVMTDQEQNREGEVRPPKAAPEATRAPAEATPSSPRAARSHL